MNYVQHSLIGLGTAGAGLWVSHQILELELPDAVTMGVAAALIVIGSVSPDLDHPKSFVSRYLPLKILKELLPPLILMVGLVVGLSIAYGRDVEAELYRLWMEIPPVRWALAGIGFALGLIIAAQLVSKAVKHRGPFHSAAFSVLVTLAATGLAVWASRDWGTWFLGASFGYGFLWHILADGLTARGIPLWWPITNKRVRFFS